VLKRLIDIGLSGLLLVVLSPALAICGVLVAMDMGRPVLFTQRRAGLGGSPFQVFKFRTMTAPGDRLHEEARLTKLGRALRSVSLDELPQLWNVLKGDMSFVGPRPLPIAYLPRYTPQEAARHNVKPGLTGWAQVNGRNAISWEEKFAMDIWYVEHASLVLDFKIMLMTAAKILRVTRVDAAEGSTMPEFRPDHSAHKG
jgi:sugar transferase EpsL